MINATSMHKIRTIVNNRSSTTEGFSWIAFDPTMNKYYVTRSVSNLLDVIDGKTDSVVKTLTVGSFPVYVAVNPRTHMVYVVNKASNSVSVIDDKTDNFLAAGSTGNQHTFSSPSIGFSVDSHPTRLAVNPDAEKLYVTYGTSDKISVMDETTNRLINTVRVGYLPIDIAITPSTGRAYITEKDSKTAPVINGDRE